MSVNKNYDYYEHVRLNSFRELIELNANKKPNSIAFKYKEGTETISKTYLEVYKDVVRLSNYLKKQYQNKHIALIGENSYSLIILFLAIVISGNTCVLIDKDLNLEEIKEFMKKSDTKIIYYSENYCPFLNKIKNSIPLTKIKEYILKEENLTLDFSENPKDDAVLFFTSGTTGPNKCVVLTSSNILADLYGASSLFTPGNKVVSMLPYHHAFGLITSVLKPYYYGVETYINKSYKTLLKDLQEEKPETIFVVPAFITMFYKQIWKSARAKKQDKKLKRMLKISNELLKINIDLRKFFFKSILDTFGGNLKYIICGGAYLDESFIKWFRSIGIEILNGYGITECSPVVSVNRNHFYKDGSVGQICKDIKVKIIDKEICVSGPIVMKGYYKDKKATDLVLKDGFFHTGDYGYIDSEGFLFITGRIKNIIVLDNGENISPEAIEQELMQQPGILEVIVYSKNNRLIASIYPSMEYMGNIEYFEQIIYKYNADKPKNHQFAFVELRNKEFIKNNNGKILRDKVEE